MKCIVEALEDMLSRPQALPLSQDCLATLRSGRSRPTFQPCFLHPEDQLRTQMQKNLDQNSKNFQSRGLVLQISMLKNDISGLL